MNVREGFMKLAALCGSAGAVLASWSDLDPSRNLVPVAVYMLLGIALLSGIAAVVVTFAPKRD